MLRRVLPATLLVVAGTSMLGAPESTLPGVFLVGVGLAVVVLPAYLQHSRPE